MWAGSVVVLVLAVLALGANFPPPRPPFLCPSHHDNTGYDGARHSSTSTPLEERVCVQCTSRQGTHESLALMIASCGAAWQDYKVQAQCFRGTTIPDAFMGVPYTNPFTNRTYVNAYCAICNGEDPTRLDPWLFSLVCEDARRPLYRPDHYDGVYFDSVDHHIVYFSDGTWNAISPDVAVSASLPCHTAIAEPIRVVHTDHGTPRPPHHSTPPLCFSRSASSGVAPRKCWSWSLISAERSFVHAWMISFVKEDVSLCHRVPLSARRAPPSTRRAPRHRTVPSATPAPCLGSQTEGAAATPPAGSTGTAAVTHTTTTRRSK
ncbi:uncharacterized protein LOC135096069 [Scylla paramamosain]|uniref:uncharacterized protein LOC135096069 n=1 Tax=Scylla paramamosain TaxID=85552 RepID=UPI00308396CE